MEARTITKKEDEKLKRGAEIDEELFNQLSESFKNIKSGKIRRVK